MVSDCLQIDELDLPGLLRELQAGDSDREMETLRARGTGVHVEHALSFDTDGFVRVAADHDLKTCRGGVEVEVVDIVQHVDSDAVRLRDCRGWQRIRPGVVVYVPSDCYYRGQSLQGFQDFRFAYVACMDDEAGTFERADGFGAQQTVRVGDETNVHSLRQQHHGSARKGELLAGLIHHADLADVLARRQLGQRDLKLDRQDIRPRG